MIHRRRPNGVPQSLTHQEGIRQQGKRQDQIEAGSLHIKDEFIQVVSSAQ